MEFLLKASAVIVLFYLCYKLFLQGETFFESNRWFLLSGLVLSVCVPFLIIPIYVENVAVSGFTVVNETNTALPIIEESFDYFKLLPLIYGLGVIFFFTKLCIEFWSLFKLLNTHVSRSSSTTKYIETEEAISPFSFFNYIVYNPKQFNSAELEHIINHEKVHARQWHSLDIILAQIATIVFWFNPFIWFYKKDLQQNLEFIADQNAQRVSACQKSYQHLLLKATVSNQQLVLANNFYNSLIKKRIIMLHKSKSHKLNVLKYALVIPLLALFLMSFNTVEVYNNDTSPFIEINGDIEMVIITKDFKDLDLEKVKKEFNALGVTLKFKSIKRNNAGEIIAIKIDAKTSKSNVSFNTNSDEGICPIKIVYNSEGHNISIGNNDGNSGGQHDYHFSTKDGKHKIVTSGSGSNVFIVKDEHEDHEGHKKHKGHKYYEIHDSDEDHNVEVIIEDEDGNNENVYIIRKGKDGKEVKERINYNDDGTHSWIEVDNKDANEKHEIILKGDNSKDSMIFISSDGNESPLILIDDKESSKEAMEKLSPNSIEKMEVLKGDKATSVYGEKGKDGVIIITTKKK